MISSKWENFDDIIEEGITGLGYGFTDVEKLISVLEKVAKVPDMIIKMRKKCVLKADDFTTGKVVRILNIGG